LVNRRPTRIPEPEDLGDLVEALACGVVAGSTEAKVGAMVHQVPARVPTGGHERQGAFGLGPRGLSFEAEQRRDQMAVQVIDADQGEPPSPREGRSEAYSYQERANETGTGRHGDELNRPASRLERSLDKIRKRPEVLARGDLRDHSTVGCVGSDLTGQKTHFDTTVTIHDRDGALVARSLDA
jgi:hypothetical protein